MKIDVLDKGYVRLVDKMGTDLSVVNGARVSYDKESEELSAGDRGLLNFLIREGHTSPFRQATLQFEVYAPLMVARQWWKYHVASSHTGDQHGWNESSRRYITEEPRFYFPDDWREAPENSKQGSGANIESERSAEYTKALRAYVLRGQKLYETAIANDVAVEQARLFLPAYGMYVRWRWTVSLQGVLHFLDERLAGDAQHEISEFAEAVETVLGTEFPATYTAWRKHNG